MIGTSALVFCYEQNHDFSGSAIKLFFILLCERGSIAFAICSHGRKHKIVCTQFIYLQKKLIAHTNAHRLFELTKEKYKWIINPTPLVDIKTDF